jgi:drug/metabolite transporter (DMT)-like permease
MLVSGLSLAFHFALWVWGIDHTSLTHALLYVSITPILIAAGMWAMNKPLSKGERRTIFLRHWGHACVTMLSC